MVKVIGLNSGSSFDGIDVVVNIPAASGAKRFGSLGKLVSRRGWRKFEGRLFVRMLTRSEQGACEFSHRQARLYKRSSRYNLA